MGRVLHDAGRLEFAGAARDVLPRVPVADDRVSYIRFVYGRAHGSNYLSRQDIKKCAWVKWAEMLAARGLTLTDKDGTEWRPRLKVSGGRKVAARK